MKKLKTLALWVVLIALFLVLFQLLGGQRVDYHENDLQSFEGHLAEGRVTRVWADSDLLTVTLRDPEVVYTLRAVVTEELRAQLAAHGVDFAWGEPTNPLKPVLIWGLPVLLLLAALVFFARRSAGATTNILSLRSSRARLISEDGAVTFAEVGGCADAKEQLGDIIDFLRDPERWQRAGVRLPRGVLLEGPPGCGKTLLARAVAGETDARFFMVSASEFVEMFVGVGAARVRDMFENAAKQAPAVIFIDELDAVGRRRGSGIGAGHDEREQTLNQLLVSMDGFEQNDQVVVIGATNRPDILDPALLRTGRFDRRVSVPALTREARRQVLDIHCRNKRLAADVDLDAIAEESAGRSGSDLESLVNEAALLAVRDGGADVGEPTVTREHFERAARPEVTRRQRFNKLDALLIESTSQLAQPTGRARVRLTLEGNSTVEGDLIWADATMIKIRTAGNATDSVVPKFQIRRIETLDGTEAEGESEITPDRWAGHVPDMA